MTLAYMNADLSKEAKETLYQFHREHEPNAALRFLRQRVWLWRRMDPGEYLGKRMPYNAAQGRRS